MSSVSGSTQVSSGTKAMSSTWGNVGLGKKEFLQVLCAELSNQNPLEPMKNSEFMGQLAQLAQIDFTDQMRKVELATQALGKQVRLGQTLQGDTVEGVVEAISLRNGQPYLIVQGVAFPVEALLEVSSAEVSKR
ncbi:MAG: flagellar hook capping FlgD N-terminal domain-containing protein [Bacillota bacterium]